MNTYIFLSLGRWRYPLPSHHLMPPLHSLPAKVSRGQAGRISPTSPSPRPGPDILRLSAHASAPTIPFQASGPVPAIAHRRGR